MLKAGIVGLPNVGKSTLFNALTRTTQGARRPTTRSAPSIPTSASSPCRTTRLTCCRKSPRRSVVIPAAIEFVDIAGLVAGASKGEGLGNQFLANIREVDAIVQVVRCFEDSDIVHTMGGDRSGARHRGRSPPNSCSPTSTP
jgi:ribosome-binding ATPase YchF (GTP1/OBG family)